MGGRKHPDFGATGQFPKGKLRADDEGELRFGVSNHKGNVILDFGTPVIWMGIPPATARLLAAALLEHADKVEGKTS